MRCLAVDDGFAHAGAPVARTSRHAAANRSAIARAWASLMISGGERRIAFLPHSSTSRPRWKQTCATASRQLGRRQLDANHQADAAHLGDRRLALSLVGERGLRGVADARRVGDQLALQQLDRGQARRDRRPGCPRSSSRGCRPARSCSSRRAIIAPSGMPDAIPLASSDHVGDHAGVFGREHLPRAPHARLHLVEHQQDAVAVAIARSRGRKSARRHDVAALAQHGLDDDRRDVVGRRDRSRTAPRRCPRRRRWRDTRRAAADRSCGGTSTCWRSATATPACARGSRRGTRSAPGRPRVVAGELDRRLHRLGPRVGQERLPVVRVGADAAAASAPSFAQIAP